MTLRLAAALAMLAACLAAALPACAQAPLTDAEMRAKAAYAIYVSPGSRKFLESDSYDLKSRVNRWRDALRERGLAYAIVTHPAQLAQVPAGAALILPSAMVLPDDERRLLIGRMDAGASLLATGMPGTLDANGAPVAATFIEQVFGVGVKARPAGDLGFLVTVGDTPLTHALAPGTRVWVGKGEKYATPLLSVTGAGYLSDWSRAPGEGLITFKTVGKSRRVLLGWTENVWDAKSPDYRALTGLAIDWIAGKPAAFARTWPWPYRGAVTLGIDALWRFENVPRIAEITARNGAHASFHFLSSDAKANAPLIRDLEGAGHSVGGFGDTMQPFAGAAENVQQARVERMVQDFRDALGADFHLSGLRAPQGATDALTEQAASELDYLVDAGRVDAAIPVRAGGRNLVVLAASANLDGNASADAIAAALASASARSQTIGGYAFVGVDGAAVVRDSALENALAGYIDSVTAKKAGGTWLATAAEAADWWRARAEIRVASRWQPGDPAMAIEVESPVAMRYPLAISVVPPAGFKSVRLDDAPGAQVAADADGAAVIVLNAVAAGSTRLSVRFLP